MKRFAIYAPVIIPTLCRFEHFKRCIDSLSRCTGAEYTDVYVGVDYPTKDEHWDGYKKICNYVKDLKGFNNLFVIKRDYNFGPQANMTDLRERVRGKTDRFIFSEDDNEFSPNFLDYMNEGLTRFKDDPNVLRICGCMMPWSADYNDFIGGFGKNAYPAKDYNAFGIGSWFAKLTDNPYTKDGVLKSWRLTFKAIHCGSWGAINIMLNLLNKESQLPDVCMRLFCTFNNKYCIFPTVSKVKNWGHDGTGINSINEPHLTDIQFLDTAKEFYFDDFVIKDYPEIKEFISQMYGVRTVKKKLGIVVGYIFYRLMGMRIRDFREKKIGTR